MVTGKEELRCIKHASVGRCVAICHTSHMPDWVGESVETFLKCVLWIEGGRVVHEEGLRKEFGIGIEEREG